MFLGGEIVGGDVPIAPKSPHRRTVREAGPYDLLPRDGVGAGIHDRPASYAAGGDRAPLPTVAPADSRALTRPPIGALLLTLAQPVLCHFVADNRGPALNPPRFICRRQRFGGFLESASLYLPPAALRRFPLQPSIGHPVGAGLCARPPLHDHTPQAVPCFSKSCTKRFFWAGVIREAY